MTAAEVAEKPAPTGLRYYHDTDVSNRESILKYGLSTKFCVAAYDGIFFHTKLTDEGPYTDTWEADLTGYEVEEDTTTDPSRNPDYDGDSWWVVWETIPPERLKLVRKGKMLTAAVEETSRSLWHGGRISGPIDIQAPTKGRYEAGPGLYLTTSYQRACKYAKGGGSTFLVTLKDNLNFAEDVSIPLAEGVQFATKYLGGKGKLIAADLKNNCTRMNKDMFTANILINLVVNYEAGSGTKGRALLQFLQNHNVDAAIEDQSGGEQWVVVFNPNVITKVKKTPASEVTLEMWNLPKIASAPGKTTFNREKNNPVPKELIAPHNAKHYAAHPNDLLDVLNDRGAGEFSRDGNTIGLRGAYRRELGNPPKASFVWSDGVPTKNKLGGTSAILLSGDFRYNDPSEDAVRNAIGLAGKYGDSDYIAVIQGGLAKDEDFNDIGEAVISNPRIIIYIPKDTPSATGQELSPAKTASSVTRDNATWKGRPFTLAAVSLLDGQIEEVHPYKECKAIGWHHTEIFSPEITERERSDYDWSGSRAGDRPAVDKNPRQFGSRGGDITFFWVNNAGKVQSNQPIPPDIMGKIEGQIKIIHHTMAANKPAVRPTSDISEGWILPDGKYVPLEPYRSHFQILKSLGYDSYLTAFREGFIRVAFALDGGIYLETTDTFDKVEPRLKLIESRLPPTPVSLETGEGNEYACYNWNHALNSWETGRRKYAASDEVEREHALQHPDAESYVKEHYTGYINPTAYTGEKGMFNWQKKEKYPKLLKRVTLKDGTTQVELRQDGTKNKYLKMTEPEMIKGTDGETDIPYTEPMRKANGDLVYLSDEEVSAKGYPVYDTAIMVFNDVGECVGQASDEWGADLVAVREDYQRKGLGTILMTEFRRQFTKYRTMGQMTPAGRQLAKSYWKSLVNHHVPKTAAPRNIWYHGSPFKNLRSILAQGLIPEVKQREWQEDPDASIYKPSRESYGGIYVTTNLSTAVNAPRDTGYYGPGRMVLVAMELQPNTMYMDEDDINFTPLSNASPHLSDSSYRAPGYYIAMTQSNVPENWKEALEEIKTQYVNECMNYWKKFKFSEDQANEGFAMHPQLEARFRELLPATWAAALTRQAAHAAAKMKDYDVSRAYHEVFYDVPYDKIPPKEQLVPTIAEGEQAWRKACDQLTRTLKLMTRPNPRKYRDTARITTPIGYHGSNRILAVAEVREGHQWRGENGNDPVTIILHYGTLPEDFFKQWKERNGSEINLQTAKKAYIRDVPGEPEAWRDVVPMDVMEEYSYGNCTRLAMALNRRFGWPIMVGYVGASPEDQSIIQHAWVKLPDGRELDVCGFDGHKDFEPFSSVKQINDWHELMETTGADETELVDADLVIDDYIIPGYLKGMEKTGVKGKLGSASLFMYHRTHQSRVETILKDGLKINSEKNLTEAGAWATDVYGCNPIYLSVKPDTYNKAEDSVLLKVDVTGLELVADLPGLVDEGGYLSNDGMYFEPGTGKMFSAADEDDEYEVEYEDLLAPSSWECKKAIELTQSAACLQDIPPERIVYA
jgi:hypothetical protein